MLIPGSLIADRFEIEALVATGGMGEVHRARDRETGKHVAVKIRSGSGVRDVDRFAYEAHVLAELHHPGIVGYVGHGTTPAGILYLAMEWLEGEDLSDRLARAGTTIDEAISVARGVAEALAAAHARGIVHRDIKPSNIFLVNRDVRAVRILDFGIARLGYGRTLATGTGTLLGTPGYMAPEQAEGRKDPDAQVDVFSLGCVLYECLTGRAAFEGDHVVAILKRVLFEDPPSVRSLNPEVPRALDHLVATMLAKGILEARPRDAQVVVASLDALAWTGAQSRPPPAFRRAPSLADAEQRLMAVVLVARAGGGTLPGSTLKGQPTLAPEMARSAVLQRGRELTAAASSDRGVDEVRSNVEAYGGRLERLADGSLLAIHAGATTAGDLATRAARCALALRGVMPDSPIAVATGRGIATGRFPVGEAVDSATRALRSAPASGDPATVSIRLDDVTARLVESRFALRGDATGVELVGENDGGDAARTLLGRPSACVGRERELAAVGAIFEEGLAEPAARAVLLTGAPGVGKSRLAAEYLRRLESAGPEMEIWNARGDPILAGTSFGLLSQVIRQAAGVDGAGPLAARRDRLRARVAARLPAADVERVAVFLAELAGAPYAADEAPFVVAARQDAMLMGDQMQRAFEDWLDAECARSPVVLLLEDLHFGDLPTLRFVDAALRHLRSRPFLVLALGRPEVTAIFPELRAGPYHEVRVGDLGRRACGHLVRAALGPAAPEEVISRLAERCAGNPFYLEELIRAEAAGKAEHGAPRTVLAMVQSRLDELEPMERRVLRAASVFGEVFWTDALCALLGDTATKAEIERALSALAQRELVGRRSTGRLAGHEEHAFRHALVREAAYARLTEGDRMLGHRLAGAWLEAAGETQPRLLAHHFEQGGDALAAAAWYGKAAEAALEGNDFASVIELVEKAIACGASEAVGLLRFRQAEAHRWRGEFGDAERRGLDAIERLSPGSDPWLLAVGEMATVLGKLGNTDRVAELGALLVSIRLDAPPTTDAYATALSRTSTALLLMGRVELADALHDALERATGDLARRGPLAEAWLERARAFRAPFRGETGASARYFQRSASAFDAAGDLRNACLQRANYGASCLEVGDWEGAERALEPTIADAERMGAKHIVSSAKRDLGYARARLGRLDDALQLMTDAVDEFQAHGDRRLEGVGRDELAFIHHKRGDLDAALAEASHAVERLDVAPAYQCHALATLARVLVARGAAAQAVESARQSLALLREVGALEEGEGLVRLSLAEALVADGRIDEARAVLQEACAEIDRRAAPIADPDLRRTFLEAIPEHVETRELARVLAGRLGPREVD